MPELTVLLISRVEENVIRVEENVMSGVLVPHTKSNAAKSTAYVSICRVTKEAYRSLCAEHFRRSDIKCWAHLQK